MTESGIPKSTVDPTIRPSAPRSVLVAFWLWWPLLVTQAALLAFMIYRLVQQIVTYLGPGAEWVIFIAGPLALVLVVLLIVEIPRVFALRRGRRGARTVLVVFAILTVLVTGWLLVSALQGLQDPYDESFSRLYALATGALFFVAVAALVGGILPFLPVASHYFLRTVTARQRRRAQRADWSTHGYRPAGLDVEGEPAPETSAAEPARRRRRTKVAAAIGGGLLLVAVLIAMAVPGGPLNHRYNREAPVDLSAFEEVDWDRYVDLTVYDDEYEGEHFIAYGTIQGASGSCPSVAFVDNVQHIDADDYREWKCLLPAAGDVSDPDPPNLSAFETGTHVKMWVTVVTEKMRGDERFPVDLNSFAVHHLEEIPDR